MTQYNQDISIVAGDSYAIKINVTGTFAAEPDIEFYLMQDGIVVLKKTDADELTFIENVVTIPLTSDETILLRGRYEHRTRLISGDSVSTVTAGYMEVDNSIPTIIELTAHSDPDTFGAPVVD